MLAKALAFGVYPSFVKERKGLVAFCVVLLVTVFGAGIWLLKPSKNPITERFLEKSEAAVASSSSGQEFDREDLAFGSGADEAMESVLRLEKLQIRSLESLLIEDDHSHSLGLWLGALDPPPNEWDARSIKDLGSLEFQFTTPDGEMHRLSFDRFTSIDLRKGTYLGSVRSSPASQAIFSYVNDAVVATLRLPERNIAWEIRNQGDGVQLFEKVDLSQMKTCQVCRDE